MQPYLHDVTQTTENCFGGRGGGRIASAAYRESLHQSDDFCGLEADTNRYDLLLMVKRVGKAAGFSPRMIQLLDYYMAYTRDIDWLAGSRPVVYQSLARTALDMGVSERQIQKLEKQLFELGALTWHDSGNHRRYGQRDPKSGRILYAFGVDLTPLSYLQGALQEKLDEKRLYEEAWMETKRQISWYRRQIRSLLLEREAEEGRSVAGCPWQMEYQRIAVEIRTYMKLPALRRLLKEHHSLHAELLAGATREDQVEGYQNANSTPESTRRREKKFALSKNTTQRSFDKSNGMRPADSCYQKEVPPPQQPEPSTEPVEPPKGSVAVPRSTISQHSAESLRHIKLRHLVAITGERLRGYLPLPLDRAAWSDLIEAAYRTAKDLNVPNELWGRACRTLGREGAAVCMVLVERGMNRETDPIRRPAAYFRAMVDRALAGELRLHDSVFGLLKQQSDRDR